MENYIDKVEEARNKVFDLFSSGFVNPNTRKYLEIFTLLDEALILMSKEKE